MLLNIYFYFIVNTRGYPWISVDIKKLCGYPHNGYLTNIDTGTRHIFIQRVGYGELLSIPKHVKVSQLGSHELTHHEPG